MRNRFELAPQALILSAGVILSVIMISIMVSQFEKTKNLSNAVSQRLIDQSAKIAEGDIVQYDGITVTGADVRNFYRRYVEKASPAIEMMSVDNGIVRMKYDSRGHYRELNDPSGTAFVGPADLYKCRVTVNDNGVITNVDFTKE